MIFKWCLVSEIYQISQNLLTIIGLFGRISVGISYLNFCFDFGYNKNNGYKYLKFMLILMFFGGGCFERGSPGREI